ncbi:MAG: cytochrome c biogenesis protein ResB, partial [Pseudomonadota bacterium]
MASQKTFIQRLWDLFCSLKLTVFFFIVLALASTIGTVIPQNAPPSEYLKLYTVSIYGAIEYLGLVDLYHSWWFVCLLILLCINVLACSFKNFPRTWKTISRTRVALEEDQTKNLPFLETIRVKIPLDEAREKVMHVLKKHLGHPQKTTINGTFHLFVEKGKYSRLGVYITHLSILIVLGGGLIGSFFGLKGFVNIMEGQTVDRIVLSKNSFPYELGFKVRCNDFEVTYYPNGAPKDYRSAL